MSDHYTLKTTTGKKENGLGYMYKVTLRFICRPLSNCCGKF